jgi:hypothetical protein
MDTISWVLGALVVLFAIGFVIACIMVAQATDQLETEQAGHARVVAVLEGRMNTANAAGASCRNRAERLQRSLDACLDTCSNPPAEEETPNPQLSGTLYAGDGSVLFDAVPAVEVAEEPVVGILHDEGVDEYLPAPFEDREEDVNPVMALVPEEELMELEPAVGPAGENPCADIPLEERPTNDPMFYPETFNPDVGSTNLVPDPDYVAPEGGTHSGGTGQSEREEAQSG